MKRRHLIQATAAAAAGAIALSDDAAGATASSDDASAQAAGRTALGGRRRVHVVLFDGVEELDFAAPLQSLGIAGRFGAPIEITLVAVDGPRTVRASHGTEIKADGAWAPGTADMILVPGGGTGRDADKPGVAAEIRRGTIPAALRAARRPGLVMASVCTGALLLGAAGLVRGRPCTTHHGAKDLLAEQGGKVINGPGAGTPGPRVVDDGDLLTSAGITSGLELALWFVERTYGSEMSMNVEMVLEYERRGLVYRNR
ncbi:DJ-1/PfpI family protein [Nonomuraea fuscirosea]|uniref:DJ-1/PfpI family protein n=1 Tax=Nonomuraea fuscirosea TaxID=1291556 RepID=UPI0033E23D7F